MFFLLMSIPTATVLVTLTVVSLNYAWYFPSYWNSLPFYVYLRIFSDKHDQPTSTINLPLRSRLLQSVLYTS